MGLREFQKEPTAASDRRHRVAAVRRPGVRPGNRRRDCAGGAGRGGDGLQLLPHQGGPVLLAAGGLRHAAGRRGQRSSAGWRAGARRVPPCPHGRGRAAHTGRSRRSGSARTAPHGQPGQIADSPALLAREQQAITRNAAAVAALLAAEAATPAATGTRAGSGTPAEAGTRAGSGTPAEAGTAADDLRPQVAANALLGMHRALIDYVRRRVIWPMMSPEGARR